MTGHCRVIILFPAGLSPAPERRAPAEVIVATAEKYIGARVMPACIRTSDELTATVSFSGRDGAVDGPTLVRAARFVRELAGEFRAMQKGGVRHEISVNARMDG